MFRECDKGRGGVLVMSGPVGTGKTDLLHSFAEWTLQSDALVLTATAAKTEREQHYEVLAQLFHPLANDPEHRDVVDRLLHSDACATAHSGSTGAEVDEAQVRVFHMLWTLLTRELAKRPVVMLVDDVQYSDQGSFRGLLFMARRFRLARGMMVLTEQTGPHLQQEDRKS